MAVHEAKASAPLPARVCIQGELERLRNLLRRVGELHHSLGGAEALAGVSLLSETEGIIPALETAHAVHALAAVAEEIGAGGTLVFNCSGRGDKDMATISAHLFGDEG